LETRALELETRALELETRALELEIQALELETQALELETLALELKTQAPELETRALELKTQALESNEMNQSPAPAFARERLRRGRKTFVVFLSYVVKKMFTPSATSHPIIITAYT
jgi:hypothetical protein